MLDACTLLHRWRVHVFSAIMSVITQLNGTDETENFMGVRAKIAQP